MKIAVSSYSFSQALNDERMNMMDIIPTARKMGYEGVEIVRGGLSHAEMLSLAGELEKQSRDEGIPIIAYMVGADFLKNGLDKQVETLKTELEVAARLNTKRMRHDSTGGRDADGRQYTVEEALPIVAEDYRRVTEYAAGLGIHTMIENHGYFFQHSSRVKKLIETAGWWTWATSCARTRRARTPLRWPPPWRCTPTPRTSSSRLRASTCRPRAGSAPRAATTCAAP